MTIQIEDVPEGMSFAEYVRATIESTARWPSRGELVAELARIEPRPDGESAAESVRHIRSGVA